MDQLRPDPQALPIMPSFAGVWDALPDVGHLAPAIAGGLHELQPVVPNAARSELARTPDAPRTAHPAPDHQLRDTPRWDAVTHAAQLAVAAAVLAFVVLGDTAPLATLLNVATALLLLASVVYADHLRISSRPSAPIRIAQVVAPPAVHDPEVAPAAPSSAAAAAHLEVRELAAAIPSQLVVT